METLFELWGKRNPEWETRYQSTIMDVFTNYGRGVDQYQDIKGRIFGAGYEIYIIAFFIGLYFDQTKPLVEDKSKRKVLGQAIMYWGNVENRLGRNSYGRIREYIFAALIAKTDVDLIALDKGEISARSIVDKMIEKMEQYANFGFDYIAEQLENDPNHFFKESAFLRVFTSFINKTEEANNDEAKSINDDEPDSLDIPKENESLKVNACDEEKARTDAEKKWKDDDIERLTLYYKKGVNILDIAERFGTSTYSVQFQLARLGLSNIPLNVTVENTGKSGTLINISGDVVYKDYAPLKIIKGTIFRFNLKPMCFTVKIIKRKEGKWEKDGKMLVAYTDSDLYPRLADMNYIDDIEDFYIGNKREENNLNSATL